MGAKGCWTCRERKLRCDQKLPTCGNCAKSRRHCQGYGVQLSWPRSNSKRAVVSRVRFKRSLTTSRHGQTVLEFLHTSFWDISLSGALREGRDLDLYLHTLQVPHLPYLPPDFLNRSDALLIDYFNDKRTRILAPILDDALVHFILRVALFSTNSDFNVVLEAILAISSMYLNGDRDNRAHQMQLISKLQENLSRVDRESVIQNLTATMLMHQYEVCNISSLGRHWTVYLCGAKKIISATSSIAQLHQPDLTVLMDWVYYHEVISEFSLRHWVEADKITDFCRGPMAKATLIASHQSAEKSHGLDLPMDSLDLIRLVCKRPWRNPDDHTPYSDSDMAQIRHYRDHIQEALTDFDTTYDALVTPAPRQEMVAQLYRYTALIYLNQAGQNISFLSASSPLHQKIVRNGMALLQSLGSCETAWPLFILACEAATDEQRLRILDVFSATLADQAARSNHVPLVQHLVQAMWNQYDLDVNNEMPYLRTLNAVISTAPFLPLLS